MKIKLQKKSNSILWYCAADDFLYALISKDSHFDLVTFEVNSFRPVSNSLIFYEPNLLSSSFVEGENIFMPSVDGRLIGINKSGNKKAPEIDLGSMMSIGDAVCDESFIYTLCAIPISNRPTTDTDISVICVNDKKTGKKKAQTCVLKGQISPISLSHEHIWVSCSKFIYKFSSTGELKAKSGLHFSQITSPIVTDHSVFVLSHSGAIEIFNHDLEPRKRFMLHKNNCHPCRNENILYWPLNGSMAQINLDTESIEKIKIPELNPVGFSVFHKNHVYVATEEGNLIDFDVLKKSSEYIFLGKGLKRPVLVKDFIFIESESEIFQICLNSR